MYTIVPIIVVIFMYLRSHHLFDGLYTEEKQVVLRASRGEIGILECKSAGLDHSVFNHQVEHRRPRRAVGDRLSGLLEGQQKRSPCGPERLKTAMRVDRQCSF